MSRSSKISLVNKNEALLPQIVKKGYIFHTVISMLSFWTNSLYRLRTVTSVTIQNSSGSPISLAVTTWYIECLHPDPR